MTPLPRRKLTLQLTPLLDLMLIVIFAQYLELRQISVQQQTAAHRQVQAVRSALEVAEAQISAQQQDVQQQRAAIQRLTEDLQQAGAQRERLGELVGELFRVPDDVISQVLGRDHSLSDTDVARLRASFRQLATTQPAEVVKHLLTHEELRKRADIWDLYIRENGTTVFRMDDETHEFRAETPEAFADRLFSLYKSAPQPKSLVLLLLSYGDARAGVREAARRGLPAAAERMQDDAGGRSRFDYAILGYRPESPLDAAR